MKILLKVLGTICAVFALLACFGGMIRNFSDASDSDYLASDIAAGKAQIEEMRDAAAELGTEYAAELDKSIAELDQTVDSIPMKGAFTTAAWLMVGLGLLSVLLIVFQYVVNQKIATGLLVATLIIGILTIVLSPVVAETLVSGVSNRKLAYFAAIPAILAAITAFLIARMKEPLVIA